MEHTSQPYLNIQGPFYNENGFFAYPTITPATAPTATKLAEEQTITNVLLSIAGSPASEQLGYPEEETEPHPPPSSQEILFKASTVLSCLMVISSQMKEVNLSTWL